MPSLFDPERPRLANGLPTYMGASSVLPSFTLTLLADGKVRVMAFVMKSPTRYGPEFWTGPPAQWLQMWLEDYVADPEAFLTEHFNLRLEEALKATPSPELDLPPKGRVERTAARSVSNEDLDF